MREREDRADFTALAAHRDHGSQGGFNWWSQHLDREVFGGSSSAGRGSGDLHKTEVIRRWEPWRDVNAVEIAAAERVEWYNHRRLNDYAGDMPPDVLGQSPLRPTTTLSSKRRETNQRVSGHAGRIN